MPKSRMSDEQWLNVINECRASGLTDKDWCTLQGIHTSTFYRAIRRLRNKACLIPAHDQKVLPLPQEVVEIASVDENGLITQAEFKKSASLAGSNGRIQSSYDRFPTGVSFESTVRIITPSGTQVELTNNSTAAVIRNVLDALQSV